MVIFSYESGSGLVLSSADCWLGEKFYIALLYLMECEIRPPKFNFDERLAIKIILMRDNSNTSYSNSRIDRSQKRGKCDLIFT